MKTKAFSFVNIAAMIIGGIFIYSGILKIISPQEFSDTISAYQLLPYQAHNLLAIFLPFVELVSGISVLWKKSRRASAFILAGCCITFIIATTWAMIHNLDINCGCFGKLSSISGINTIILDTALIILCGFIIIRSRYQKN